MHRFKLITNVQTLTIGHMWVTSHALLISDMDDNDRPHRHHDVRLRAFLTDSCLEVLTIVLASPEHTLVPEDYAPFGHPVQHRLDTADGRVQMTLHAMDARRPIDVLEVEANPDERAILRVWEELSRRVADHWTHPRMPIPQYVAPSLVLSRHQ